MTASVETPKFPLRDPSIFLSIRLLVAFSVALPTVIVYACVISSYITHADTIANYTLASCPTTHSAIAPVSFSIASWKPQRQLWMVSVVMSIPARALIMLMVPQIWHGGCWKIAFQIGTFLEMLGIVVLSLVHDEGVAEYYIHFSFFGMWWMATICVMIIVVHMQRVTGHIQQELFIYRTWLAKIGIMIAFILGSCAITASYPLAQTYCSVAAFVVFCLGEYALIALNAAFWSLVIVDFSRDFEGFQIVSIQSTRRNCNKVAPTTPTTDEGKNEENKKDDLS